MYFAGLLARNSGRRSSLFVTPMYDTYLQAFFVLNQDHFTGLRVIVARSVRFHTLRIFYSHLHTITCSHM